MKRIISAILCVLMLASFAVLAANAEFTSNIVGQTASTKDFVVFDFTVPGQTGVGINSEDAGGALFWGKSKRFDSEYLSEDGCTRLKFVDPTYTQAGGYLTACIPASLQFDPTEFKFMKISYRCDPELVDDETYAPMFFFGMSELDPDGEGAAYYKGQWGPETYVESSEPYISDNQWHDLYVDMTDCSFWGDSTYGFVSEIRLDYLPKPELIDAHVDIKYIALLKTEGDAESFGINELGKFGFLEVAETTPAEEATTVAELATTVAEAATTVGETATTVAEEKTTITENATTVAEGAVATTAVEATTTAEATESKGCGGIVGGAIVTAFALIPAAFMIKKKKD